MLSLNLIYENKPQKTYTFDNPQIIRIGRKKDNDIALQDKTVSGYHATIEFRESAYLLTDLHSKNGTFVNESFVNSCWLNEGDRITIGGYKITFSHESQLKSRYLSNVSMNESDPMEKTAVLDTRRHKEMRAKSFLEVALGQKEAEQNLSLLFLSGGEGRIQLSKKMTTIGKGPGVDVVVKGLLIGKIAATITRRPNGYYLSVTSGLTKPKVNGQPVKKSIMLKEFDMIDIGTTQLRLTRG